MQIQRRRSGADRGLGYGNSDHHPTNNGEGPLEPSSAVFPLPLLAVWGWRGGLHSLPGTPIHVSHNDVILLIHTNDPRRVPLDLFFSVILVTEDDNLIPPCPFAGSWTVQDNVPSAPRACHGVRQKPFSLIQVGTDDRFIRQNTQEGPPLARKSEYGLNRSIVIVLMRCSWNIDDGCIRNLRLELMSVH